MHIVTGANGFLGLYLVEQLTRRGLPVRAVCRRSNPDLEATGAELFFADVTDRQAVSAACAGGEVVYHTAAVAGIWGKWEHFHQTNTLGTQHVIEGCRAQRVPKLIYTSSPSVTFDGSDQCGVDESAPYPDTWLCHYPHSKALAEQAVLAANGADLLTCSLRPHLIWGPRDRHLIPRLIERAQSGKLRRVGDGENLVDMIYIENAAVAHIQAAAALAPGSAVAGKAYFISQGEPVNCWQWIDEILSLAGLPPLNKSISRAAAWRIGSVLEGVYRLAGVQSEPRMTRFLAAQLATSHYFDISAARRDFGYQPTVSTAEGMQRLGRWLGAPNNA